MGRHAAEGPPPQPWPEACALHQPPEARRGVRLIGIVLPDRTVRLAEKNDLRQLPARQQREPRHLSGDRRHETDIRRVAHAGHGLALRDHVAFPDQRCDMKGTPGGRTHRRLFGDHGVGLRKKRWREEIWTEPCSGSQNGHPAPD